MIESDRDLLGVAVVGFAKPRKVCAQERQGKTVRKVLDRRRTPQSVVLIEGVVDAKDVLILSDVVDRIKDELVGPKIRRWNELQQTLRNGAEVGGGNYPVGPERAVRSSGGLPYAGAVLQRDGRNVGSEGTTGGATGKIAGALGGTKYGRIAAILRQSGSVGLAGAVSLVGEKEKRVILPDRPANGCTEEILVKGARVSAK